MNAPFGKQQAAAPAAPGARGGGDAGLQERVRARSRRRCRTPPACGTPAALAGSAAARSQVASLDLRALSETGPARAALQRQSPGGFRCRTLRGAHPEREPPAAMSAGRLRRRRSARAPAPATCGRSAGASADRSCPSGGSAISPAAWLRDAVWARALDLGAMQRTCGRSTSPGVPRRAWT